MKALGIPLDANPEELKIIVNGIDLLESMKIGDFKIVKVLK